MTNIIAQSTILLLVVGINYGCMKLAKTNPDIISGFKMSNDKEQRARDEIWLRHLFNYMRRANIVTLIGGLIGIVCGWPSVYYISLFLPISVATLLGFRCRYILNKKKGKNLAVIITMLVTFIMCLPVLYSYQSDLKITFSDEELKIHGIYGVDIPLHDINEVKLYQSLPQISLRTNGFALADTRLGHFRTTNGENIMLFTHSDKFFVCITQNNGIKYYLSYKEKKTTEQLLIRIQNELEIIKNGH